jgi:regulator of sigma E protease
MLIVLHEAGHFAAAKAVGMRVERFSLFFGPMLFKRTIGETEYGIGPIPLGGFVKITGMSPNETFDSPEIEARAYINQPPWKRIVVIAAGPAVNLVLAFILAWMFFLGVTHEVFTSNGQPVSTSTVGAIVPGSAAKGVLRVGDQIVSVNGIKAAPAHIHDLINEDRCAGDSHADNCRATKPASLVVRRDGKLVALSVRPRWSAAQKEMLIGFDFDAKTAPNGVFYAAGQSFTSLVRVTGKTVTDIVEIFKPKDRKQLHSIVGTYKYTQEGIAGGFTSGVQILAVISLALGVFNLFPFLPLDGGHIFWAVAEKLRGRRISIHVVTRATYVGLALIGLLLVIGLSNDVSSIAHGGFGIH